MLAPDPTRPWFVYHNEEEIGPLPESEVKSRIQSGVFNQDSFVYTEGFEDWRPLAEVDVLHVPDENVAASLPEVPEHISVMSTSPTASESAGFLSTEQERTNVEESPASALVEQTMPPSDGSFKGSNLDQTSHSSMTTEKLGVRPNDRVVAAKGFQSAAAGAIQNTPMASGGAQTSVSVPAEREDRRTQFIKLFLLLIVVGAIGLILFDEWSSYQERQRAKNERPIVTTTQPQTALSPTPILKWDQLLSIRDSQDGRSQPFALDTRSLDQDRAIVVGALSARLPVSELWVAVFPDNERHLMALPRIWYFKVPVLDGFFSIGPLSMNGEKLPPGTYHVILRAPNYGLLGRVAFQHGVWPQGDELAEYQQRIVNERERLAVTELNALKETFVLVQGYLLRLRNMAPMAEAGPAKKVAWEQQSTAWKQEVTEKMHQQYLKLSQAAFYPSSQEALYTFMQSLYQAYENLDLVARGGQALLRKTKQMGLAQLWNDVLGQEKALENRLAALTHPEVKGLKLSEDVIKKTLEGF